MKIDYIRNRDEVNSIIEDLEKNPVVRNNLKGLPNKLEALFLYVPLEKLYNANEIGLEGDFGGRLFRVAKVKERNLLLLVDGLNRVIGLAKEKIEEENFGQKMARIKGKKK